MVYGFVEMSITNPDAFDSYRRLAESALAKHGGAVAASGNDAMVIQGTKSAPQIAAVLTFPGRDEAVAWINDPELAHVHKLRSDSGDVSIVLVGQ